MVAKKSINSQLQALGLRFWLRGRSEIQELHTILQPGELIKHCVYGYYSGGSGVLLATDRRLMLIDKRPLYLHFEELSFEAVQESLYKSAFTQSTVYIRSGAKRLLFRSLSDAKLRKLHDYIQLKLAKIARDIRDSNALVNQINNGLVPHPAWRPHAPHMIRRRPAKFHRYGSKVASV